MEKDVLTVSTLGYCGSGKSTLIGHLRYKLKLFNQTTLASLNNQSVNEIGYNSRFASACYRLRWELHQERSIEPISVNLQTSNYDITLWDTPGYPHFLKLSTGVFSMSDLSSWFSNAMRSSATIRSLLRRTSKNRLSTPTRSELARSPESSPEWTIPA